MAAHSGLLVTWLRKKKTVTKRTNQDSFLLGVFSLYVLLVHSFIIFNFVSFLNVFFKNNTSVMYTHFKKNKHATEKSRVCNKCFEYNLTRLLCAWSGINY